MSGTFAAGVRRALVLYKLQLQLDVCPVPNCALGLEAAHTRRPCLNASARGVAACDMPDNRVAHS
jgi:hypothetical protein